MSKESEDNKTLTLTVDDIGSEIEDAKVTCVKVFCPRRENNFVSFLCDGKRDISFCKCRLYSFKFKAVCGNYFDGRIVTWFGDKFSSAAGTFLQIFIKV